MRDTATSYMEKYLGQLVGTKVTGVAVDKDGEFWGLIFSDGSVAWISQDPEGNGPGHLDIVPGPKKRTGKKKE